MKKIFSLITVLAVILFFTGCGDNTKDPNKLKIVTSFYPIYIETINIAGNVDGVEVVNLTKPQTGCLHDYQLTTEDMKTLETADIFIVNGLGMENFLDKVTSAQKDLKIIDASNSDEIYLLKDGDEFNPHVWMSVTYSMQQVKAITQQLCEVDPVHADAYKKNALEYLNKLSALRDEMHLALDNLPNKDIVTFHEAFPYFAAEFKLNIVSVIEREPGTEPTPQELKETIEKVNSLPVKILFIEPQYSPKAADTIARETGAEISVLDPIVTGEAKLESADDYILKMRINKDVLATALGN
ncbi:MAG: zinc ABC transporter substrate-binding protein [Selenomonadaceae bacterium]|nr:zinc ABC transporter substrate-binding protein [Selenomonadaceae bacterium]